MDLWERFVLMYSTPSVPKFCTLKNSLFQSNQNVGIVGQRNAPGLMFPIRFYFHILPSEEIKSVCYFCCSCNPPRVQSGAISFGSYNPRPACLVHSYLTSRIWLMHVEIHIKWQFTFLQSTTLYTYLPCVFN